MTDYNLQTHTQIVQVENLRRKAQKEEEDRLAWERSERRRLKLEMKLKRRENRRLVGLERLFADTYMINADTDKDIIQISDFDGSDSNALKTVGLRGGLIGEVFLICQKLQKLPGFDQLKFKSPLFMDSLVQFWTNFVSEGYTVLIGVDPSFEKNSGTSLERLDSETVFSMA